MIVQALVIAPVVNVEPESEPLQPETLAIVYPAEGVTVTLVVFPYVTLALVGEMVEPVAGLVETVSEQVFGGVETEHPPLQVIVPFAV